MYAQSTSCPLSLLRQGGPMPESGNTSYPASQQRASCPTASFMFDPSKPMANENGACGLSDYPLHVPNLNAVPSGYSLCGENLSYNPPPAKVTQHDNHCIDHVKRFSENSKRVSILHNNRGSSLAPCAPILTHAHIVNACVRNPARFGLSRPTNREKLGVDCFRNDLSKYACLNPPPPAAINERFSTCPSPANAFTTNLRLPGHGLHAGAQDGPCESQARFACQN
jgi:hypothetical protein